MEDTFSLVRITRITVVLTEFVCPNIKFNQKKVFLNKDFSIFRARN